MKSSVAILFALVGLAAPAFSGEPPGMASAIVDKDTEVLKFDFDFPGGTLPQLISDLTAVTKQPVNITLGEGAAQIVVPKLKLFGVSTFDVLGTLKALSHSTPSLGDWDSLVSDDHHSIVWTVNVDSEREFGPTITRVVYVGDLLRKYTIDDLAAAISFAMNPPTGAPKILPKLRLHRETSLLIIEAPGREGDVAEQVLGGLREALHDSPK
jgi:hypothetical protein